MMTDDTTLFASGAAQATPEGPSDDERADVKAWFKRINDARKFDENARKRYAIDRRYARGDSGQFEVGLPIAGSYVDILKSFLYATDPDLDCQPSDATQPPPMADILKMAREQVQSDPQAQMQAEQAGQQAAQKAQGAAIQSVVGQVLPHVLPALTGQPAPPSTSPTQGAQPPMPPPDPDAVGKKAASDMIDQLVKQRAAEIMEPYQQRASEAKQLGQTLEFVVAHLWKQARLKAAAEPMVGSGHTVGIGWLKSCWIERTQQDPTIRAQMNDLQDNLARLAATREELAEGDCADPAALRAELEQQLAGLQAKVEVVVARGMAVDFVSAEDIQVSTDVPTLYQYRDASWIAHRTFMTVDDAKAAFPALDERIKNASIYTQKKPPDPTQPREVGALAEVDARDADTFRSGSIGEGTGNVCIWEIWNKAANTVLTLVEGLDGYARPPFTPNPGTKRFYPFFAYAPLQVDGERHPQSMIQRTQPLLDDMNRIYSNRAEHRRRCIPKTAFDATQYEPAEIKRLESGGIGEMVGIKPQVPGTPVAQCVQPIAYPAIDAALYDDAPTRAMLEMAWGIQEALSSAIRTAKTATEAEIQQTGTQARTGYMRDCLDGMMGDLAEYTAEVALQKMSYDDVKTIAGVFAFWPSGITIEDLSTLVLVNIKAGSSGKPDTTAQRQVWAQVMPTIQNAIVQVGQLRGSSPDDVADCIAELLAETLQRTGDNLDVERFLPKAPDTGAGSAPNTWAPTPVAAPASPIVPQGATLQ